MHEAWQPARTPATERWCGLLILTVFFIQIEARRLRRFYAANPNELDTVPS
jgi:hypothetical protein